MKLFLNHFALLVILHNNLYRSSDDGTCRVWDARSSQCPPQIYMPKPPGTLTGSIMLLTCCLIGSLLFGRCKITSCEIYLQGRAILVQVLGPPQVTVHKAIRYFVVLTMPMELLLSPVALTLLQGCV